MGIIVKNRMVTDYFLEVSKGKIPKHSRVNKSSHKAYVNLWSAGMLATFDLTLVQD